MANKLSNDESRQLQLSCSGRHQRPENRSA